MAIKIAIIVMFLGIFAALGGGLLHLLRGTGDSTKMAKSLTWRIGISVTLFVLLLLAMAFGLIKPHGV